MIQKIENSADFTTVKKAIEDFLAHSLGQCFLQVKTISRCLDQICKLCLSFCAIASLEEVELVKVHEL
jgi:hypothetical protein